MNTSKKIGIGTLKIPSLMVILISMSLASTQAAIVTTDLILNLDATQISPTPTDGQFADQWDGVIGAPNSSDDFDDVSGSGNHFLRVNADPFYRGGASAQAINGRPTVDFLNNNIMRDANGLGLSGNNAYSLFFVGRLDEDNDNIFGSAMLFSDDLNTAYEGFSMTQGNGSGLAGSSNTLLMEHGWGHNLEFSLGATLNTPVIIELLYDGTTIFNTRAFVNGTEVTVNTYGTDGAMAFSAESVNLGSFFSRTTDMNVGQVLMYDTNLSDAQRNQTGSQLASDWGITTAYIPEPSTLLLSLVALTAFGLARKRGRS